MTRLQVIAKYESEIARIRASAAFHNLYLYSGKGDPEADGPEFERLTGIMECLHLRIERLYSQPLPANVIEKYRRELAAQGIELRNV